MRRWGKLWEAKSVELVVHSMWIYHSLAHSLLLRADVSIHVKWISWIVESSWWSVHFLFCFFYVFAEFLLFNVRALVLFGANLECLIIGHFR